MVIIMAYITVHKHQSEIAPLYQSGQLLLKSAKMHRSLFPHTDRSLKKWKKNVTKTVLDGFHNFYCFKFSLSQIYQQHIVHRFSLSCYGNTLIIVPRYRR